MKKIAILFLSLFLIINISVESTYAQNINKYNVSGYEIETSTFKVNNLDYGRIAEKEGKTFVVVRENNNYKYGVFDLQGNVIIPIKYDNIDGSNRWSTVDSFFLLELNGKEGVVGLNNEPIVDCKYNTVHIRDNFILGYNDDKIDNMNSKGEILPFSDEIDKIDYAHSDYYAVIKDNKHGVYNFDGEKIIDIEYDTIDIMEDKSVDNRTFIIVEKDDKYGLYDGKGNLLFPPKYKIIVFSDYDADSSTFELEGFDNKRYVYDVVEKKFIKELNVNEYNKFYGYGDYFYFEKDKTAGLMNKLYEIVEEFKIPDDKKIVCRHFNGIYELVDVGECSELTERCFVDINNNVIADKYDFVERSFYGEPEFICINKFDKTPTYYKKVPIGDYTYMYAGDERLNYHYNVIDINGKELFNELYDRIFAPEDTLRQNFEVELDHKHGLVNKFGEIILPPTYKFIYYEEEEKRYRAETEDKIYYFDESGNLLYPFAQDGNGYEKTGSTIISLIGDKWGGMDIKGNTTIPYIYDSYCKSNSNYGVFIFATGLNRLWIENGKECMSEEKYGLVGSDGTVLIPFGVITDYTDNCNVFLNDENNVITTYKIVSSPSSN